MKKKLKGLIALIMAIAMVVPMTTYAFGAISEDDYNNVLSKGMRVIVEPEVSIEQEAEEGGFNASDFYDVQSEYIGVGEKPIDKACCELEFYNVVGWTIWEVQTSGYVLDDSKSKTVSVDYTVTAEDIMEYGLMSSTDSAYLPYIEAILEPKDITIDVYNAAGTTKTGEVSVNIENYMTETLDVPEGYLGYMLYAEHTEYSEDGIQSAFVSDGESLWTELQIMSCFGYEPLKLVPVTKMPYYMNIGGYVNGWEIEEAEIIYLAPGESIAENDYVASHIEHSNFAEEEVAWNVWTINYCGSTSSTPLDDYESDYVFTTTTGLSLEDYKKTRSEIYNDGYSETFYYEANFPVLGIDYSDLEYIEYEIPVYNMDDEYMFDTYVRKCDLVYYAWEIEEYAQREIWTDVSSGETCGFSFEYDGYDYGEVVYYQEIWDIAIEDGNYDYDKAKLKVVCAEHNYQKDSVVEQPTVDKKGKTKYVCSVCGTTKIVEDIDRLVALDSIVLKGSLFTYTGSNIIPGFDVKGYVNGTLTNLKKDVDYTVSYSNNKMPGIGTVTVKVYIAGVLEKTEMLNLNQENPVLDISKN